MTDQRLDRLRCANGEWKTRSEFSKSQLARYDQSLRSGRATPANTGIRCTEHAGKQNLELKCKGPCGRWRDLRLFSKSTRRNGKDWCVDCTDWQIKTENGETLPAPGSQLSVEEMHPRMPDPAHLRDDMIFEAESSVGTDYDNSDAASTMSGLSLSEQQPAGPGSLVSQEPRRYVDRLEGIVPPHLRPEPIARAPHWLIPDLGGPPSTLRSGSTSVDTISVASTAGPVRGPQARPVAYNAWGPNGEYERKVKTPTVASSSTRTENTQRQKENEGRSGWAKVPSRKQPPQLPDYLKYDTPVAQDDSEPSDGDSDGEIRLN